MWETGVRVVAELLAQSWQPGKPARTPLGTP